MSLILPPDSSSSGGPQRRRPARRRPAVRVISTLDRLGLRYLTADVQLIAGADAWPMPLPVAERDGGGDAERWTERERLVASLHRAAALDDALTPLTVKTGQLLHPDAVDVLLEYLQERLQRRSEAGPPEPRRAARPQARLGRPDRAPQVAPRTTVVVDPELFDRDGRPRSPEPTAAAIAGKLVPLADVVVANACDAAALTHRRVEGPTTMREAARALVDLGAGAALVTGAHLEGHPRDWLFDGRSFDEIGADRVGVDGVIRGAGGVLSSALAVQMARGRSLVDAADRARKATSVALEQRLWVTATGLWPAELVEPDTRPAGYWIANAEAAGRALGRAPSEG